jgi:hypothetical protein
VALDPTYARGWVRRALALEALGRVAEAHAAAAQAAALSPAKDVGDLAARLASLGDAESSLGDAKSSLGDAESSLGDAESSSLVATLPDAEHDEAKAAQAAELKAAEEANEAKAAQAAGTPTTRVSTSESAGRFVIATRELRAGGVVLRDQPLAALLNKAHRTTHCAWCFAPLPRLAAVPCARCPKALYCGSLCAQSDGAGDGAVAGQGPTHGGNAECRAPWAMVLDAEAVLATRLAAACEVGGGEELAAVGCSLVTHWADTPPEQRLQNAGARAARGRPASVLRPFPFECACVHTGASFLSAFSLLSPPPPALLPDCIA